MMFPVARQQALMEGLVLRVRSQAQGHDSSARLEEQNIIREVLKVFFYHFQLNCRRAVFFEKYHFDG
ncbi:MAG: hypothetical protein J5661_05435 [Bacteroidaceae bacterium]|nr:hypothetical protein [Bacteroidaceae bacterium]